MITEINLSDAPVISEKTRYYDGEIFFADNITSVPNLAKVFKVKFYAFVICLNGNLTLKLNNEEFHIQQYDGLFVDAASVIDILEHSSDFTCKICGFNTDVGFNFINKTIFQSIMDIHSKPVIHFKKDEIVLMLKYYELADFKISHPEMNYGKETMNSILRAYVYDLLSSVSKHLDVSASGDILRQSDKIFRRFVLLLAENKNSSRSVNSFAEELCVSPKYLTSVCSQQCNKTASEIIAMSIVGRIKQLLLYSDLSVKEVANQMGFNNLSFFGKYVKKHLGVSPNKYRELNGYGR